MTNIEQEFYKTFGIKLNGYKCQDYNCICCDEYKTCAKGKYPEITAEMLIQFICILVKNNKNRHYYKYEIYATDIEQLKKQILEDCISEKENIKEQIQSLFRKEGE